MAALAHEFVTRLAHGEDVTDSLSHSGEPDPNSAARHFAAAAADPDLANDLLAWAPTLLVSARPGFAAGALREIAERARLAATPLRFAETPTLPQVLGASTFLARMLQRHPEWLAELRGAPPAAPHPEPIPRDWTAIRLAKYRGLLRIAARDLAGRQFAAGFRELSDLADACLTAALDCAVHEREAPMPALLALGKLGGTELNFSSDVDLLFLHEPPADADPPAYNAAVAGVIERFKKGLEAPTPDGFGYRVDLDLRPEGRAGVLANSVDAALGYYESFGAEWERQMLIRLRPIAGDENAAERFCAGIAPFVYRRAIGSDVMHEVRNMKDRIESERKHAGHDLEMNLKEGPGGIRDVEFLTQWLQLFHGGREKELRTGNVLDALDALGRRGKLPETTCQALGDAYIWLRRAEHALQLDEEQQTARFPREPASQLALARRMGYANDSGDAARTRLLDDWTSTRGEVRGHFDALVLRETE
jgi:glutamate-ammonia-ligase adenylyltransferase